MVNSQPFTDTPTLGKAVRSWLESAILSGRYQAGDRIVEADVAGELRVSRGPVREAISALITEGLLAKEPRRGAVVADFSPSDVCEIYSLRVLIETYAVQLLVQRLPGQELRALDALLAEMRAAAEAADREKFISLDLEFHSSLVRLSGHRWLWGLWDVIRSQVRRFMIFNERLYGDLRTSAEIHVPVLEALRSGSSSRAREAVQAHIVESGNRVIREVRRLKRMEDGRAYDVRDLLVGEETVIESRTEGPASPAFVVVGAGGVGGFFGGLLARHGANVTFLVRERHARVLATRGLRVLSAQGDFHVRVPAHTAASAIGPADIVLVTVKSTDTEAAARDIAPLLGPDTVVVSLQNGIDNAEKLARVIGPERVLSAVVFVGATLQEPGVVRHTGAGRLVLGEPAGGRSERVERVRRELSRYGIDCSVSEDVRRELWSKLVWNAAFCGVAVLMRATVDDILRVPESRRLAVRAMEEVVSIARAEGIALGEESIQAALALSERLGRFKPSMLQDLERGRPMEVEAFFGVLVSRARERGVEAPVLTLFRDCAAAMERMREASPLARPAEPSPGPGRPASGQVQ